MSAFAMILGLAGMFGLWRLAWWLLGQPVSPASPQLAPTQQVWRNEPTPERRPERAPPGRLFEHAPAADSEDESVPCRRARANSSANTEFFSRTDLERRKQIADKTDILDDCEAGDDTTAFLPKSSQQSPPLPTAPPGGPPKPPPRKT